MDVDEEFFSQVFEMYLESVALSYTRLLDPHTSLGKYSNLSFSYLIEKTPLCAHPKCGLWLAQLREIREGKAAKKLRKARDKSIAHTDLKTYIGRGLISGVGYHKDDVETIHDALCTLLSKIKEGLNMSRSEENFGEEPHRYGDHLLKKLEGTRIGFRA